MNRDNKEKAKIAELELQLANTHKKNKGGRLIKRSELQRLLGISSVTLYRWLRKGVFPAPDAVAGDKSYWLLSSFEAWVDGGSKNE